MAKPQIRYILPLGVFVTLLVFLGIGLTLNPREIPSPFIGKPAPDFSVASLENPQLEFSSKTFKGQVSLFNVWASWCASCRTEHALLVQLAAGNGVTIYGLNYKDRREDADAWLARFGNPYASTAFDGDGRVGLNFGVYGVPETFVIDRQGVIRYKQTGPLTETVLRDTILPLVRALSEQSS